MIVEAAPGARGLDRADVEQVEAAARAARAVDGVAPLGEQPLRALREAGAEVWHLVVRVGHVARGDGDKPDDDDNDHSARVVGYAQIAGAGADATAELVVHPDHRRRGIGRALVKAVLDREPAVAVWAHGALPAAVALAEGLGMRRTRELLKMRRRSADAPALPARRVDAGVELGTLAEAASEGGSRWPGLDARAEFLRVNNAAFHWHPEQGGWTAAQLDERLAVDWVDTGAVFLAVDVTDGTPDGTPGDTPGGTPDAAPGAGGPRLAGFHWTKTVAEPGEPVEGEVYVVAVDPADQGRGLGGVLTSVGVEHLEGPVGAESVVLYVEGDNLPAVRTYEKLGFVVDLVDVTYTSA